MRDERGRYINTKFISDNGPAYARGCPSCHYGIILAPEPSGAVELYLERIVQALDHDITFCDCQAGKSYRVSLLNRRQIILEQHKRDEGRKPQHKSAVSKEALTPENTLRIDNPIDVARAAIAIEQAKNKPTMHMSGAPA
jgi:hypothetical protein